MIFSLSGAVFSAVCFRREKPLRSAAMWAGRRRPRKTFVHLEANAERRWSVSVNAHTVLGCLQVWRNTVAATVQVPSDLVDNFVITKHPSVIRSNDSSDWRWSTMAAVHYVGDCSFGSRRIPLRFLRDFNLWWMKTMTLPAESSTFTDKPRSTLELKIFPFQRLLVACVSGVSHPVRVFQGCPRSPWRRASGLRSSSRCCRCGWCQDTPRSPTSSAGKRQHSLLEMSDCERHLLVTA